MRVEEYLARIGVAPPIAADVEGLRRVHRAHLLAVPFESLDIGRGVPILLDEEALLAKVVTRRRGGFCYELNGTFAWLLRGLGFEVRMHAANVHGDGGVWGIDFDHMLLAVETGGERWMADAGFGDSFLDPLRWVEGLEQDQGWAGVFRLVRDGAWWVLERRRDAEGPGFLPQHRFQEQVYGLADFAPGCAYHQSAPESPFTQRTVCSLARPDGRLTLRTDRLIVTREGAKTETPIEGEQVWRAALRDLFGVVLD